MAQITRIAGAICCVYLLFTVRLAQADHVDHQYILFDESDGRHGNGISPMFESPEHATIGNDIQLSYPTSNIPGSKFTYRVNGRDLSFGDIIALAGDYFFNWNIGECVPAISDGWDETPNISLEVAKSNVDTLRTDWKYYVNCVLDNIGSQRNEIETAWKNGQDTAQVYAKIANSYDKSFSYCTKYGYIVISLCNPDHFGTDAIKAYSAVHTLALQQAAVAHNSQQEKDLTEAYFIEAYGQHFLTDAFAAGHIRTPRRILHSTSLDLNLFPGDRCNQKQHDEDGANGLWVSNLDGDSWASYGDKQYNQGRCAKNRQMVNTASQISIDEIWEAFKTGAIVNATQYGALRKFPIPETSYGHNNFIPLFQVSAQDSNTMLFRDAVDKRTGAQSRQSLGIKQNNDAWDKLKKTIESSGAAVNLYVFARGFESDQKVLHLSGLDSSQNALVINMYSTVNAGKFGQYWHMAAQGQEEVSIPPGARRWTKVQSLGKGVLSLVGRQETSTIATNAIHLGLKVSPSPHNELQIDTLWSDIIDDGNGGLIPGESLFGQFDEDSTDSIMVKYFDGQTSDSHLEFWSLSSSTNRPLSRLNDIVKTTNLNFLVPHKIDSKDSFSMIVGYSSGPLPTSPGQWYFCTWKSKDSNISISTISEDNAPRVQALVSDPSSHRLLRIFYGKPLPLQNQIRIDTLRPKRNESNGLIYFDASGTTALFPITWNRLTEPEYLLWFLDDVDGDGILDLVTYATDASNTNLNVVVFPGDKNGGFSSPVASLITIATKVGNLFTGDFMRPLQAVHASYTYSSSGGQASKTSAGIMAFFDNYGVIGMRMIAPVASQGTYAYEVKGQEPAIAGQRSPTIGELPESWMGLNRRSQQVGLVPVDIAEWAQ